MTTAITAVMLAGSGSLAVSMVVKATLIAALGLIGARLARGSRAAARHALLAATFAVLLILPAASLWAPPVRIALPATPPRRAAAIAGPFRPLPSALPALSARVTPVSPGSAEFSPSTLLLAAWLAGVALFLLPVAMGLWQIGALRRSAAPWPQGQSIAGLLAAEAGIRRRVSVRLHPALSGPMTCGVLDPAIVLPEDAPGWTEEDLDRALVHELEHVRRADWLSHCLARMVCAAYWFHPLVWMAWRRFALEAERSCDDAVLRGAEPAAYADQLVGTARRLSAAAKAPLLAMANRADLTTRVGAVLDSRQRRGRAGVLAVAFACAAAVALVLALAPLTLVAAPQSTNSAAVAPVARFSANTMLVVVTAGVLDASGNPVEGLNAADFVVAENGVPQPISVFEFEKVASAPQNVADSVASYYILGFYTHNENPDGAYRKITVSAKDSRMARLNYRSGFYGLRSPIAVTSGVALAAGLNTTAPVILQKYEPAYSEEARRAKYQGSVILDVGVDATGQVESVQVVRSLGLGLDEKAIEAVRKWQFRPGTRDARPAAMPVEVDVSFRLL